MSGQFAQGTRLEPQGDLQPKDLNSPAADKDTPRTYSQQIYRFCFVRQKAAQIDMWSLFIMFLGAPSCNSSSLYHSFSLSSPPPSLHPFPLLALLLVFSAIFFICFPKPLSLPHWIIQLRGEMCGQTTHYQLVAEV